MPVMEQLKPYDMVLKMKQEYKEKYAEAAQLEQPGVYAITVNSQIVYVGQSTDMLHRMISHKANAIYPLSKEYNRPMYAALRTAIEHPDLFEIKFLVLEYCDKQELKVKESQYIGQYMPELNTMTPRGRKAVTTHFLDKLENL